MKAKSMLSLLCTVVFVVVLWSCKKETETIYKESTPPADYPITGVWQGNIASYTVDNGYQDYTLFIKSDSTISTEGTALGVRHYAVGTWTMKDSLFSARIKTLLGIYYNLGVEQTFTAVFHKRSQTLSNGKWLNSTWGKDSGYFNVKYAK
ncbi:hypothetical protein LL912_06820 [Niabella sp. CC-SYL272]|uniref:hypothetical protein n=1 Tax=Niabella agricola TaxID=2891571 RepID=UPI001F35E532|nr:hypothetical protein [Niabella agricola]MCF3108484.1 hypothetical protein [Niabella agricola]